MIISYILLHSLLFSFLCNCHIFICDNPLYATLCIAAFIILNLICGFFSLKANKRLKLLYHGTIMLISFCVSTVLSVIFHLLTLFNVIPHTNKALIHSAIYCTVFLFLMFWNGIISIFVTSFQLGLKVRLTAIFCGMIPILNIAVLSSIIDKCYNEVALESKKEIINKKRTELKVCQTKYPILLVYGVFFRDNKLLNYWGRVPKELETNGATIFYGNHQSALPIDKSGEKLANRIKQIIAEKGFRKVNIIAHSKGGLDCRYAN